MSRKNWLWRLLLPLLLACMPASADTPLPMEGFVSVNGVRLQYYDWGGSGPALILVHGLADHPHVFADLAPAFTDRFHVLAYARRGSGGSDATPPYDVTTLTEDLRGLMDALGIAKAHLVGLSAGGDEITRMAAEHPGRVGRLVYLEAAYDFARPGFRAAVEARPLSAFERPPGAMTSLAAYRSYLQKMRYPGVDMQRLEANLRAKLVVRDGGAVQERTPKAVVDALYAALWTNPPRDYRAVTHPVLAIFATRYYDVRMDDAEHRREILAYETAHWAPFQARSIDRLRREVANAKIVLVEGGHSSFLFTSRRQVVDAMRRFLDGAGSGR